MLQHRSKSMAWHEQAEAICSAQVTPGIVLLNVIEPCHVTATSPDTPATTWSQRFCFQLQSPVKHALRDWKYCRIVTESYRSKGSAPLKRVLPIWWWERKLISVVSILLWKLMGSRKNFHPQWVAFLLWHLWIVVFWRQGCKGEKARGRGWKCPSTYLCSLWQEHTEINGNVS